MYIFLSKLLPQLIYPLALCLWLAILSGLLAFWRKKVAVALLFFSKGNSLDIIHACFFVIPDCIAGTEVWKNQKSEVRGQRSRQKDGGQAEVPPEGRRAGRGQKGKEKGQKIRRLEEQMAEGGCWICGYLNI